MTKCFIIEQGSYSDYRVVGIFTTRENAERGLAYIQNADHYDEPTIDERELDPAIDGLNQGLTQFRVHIGEHKTECRIITGLDEDEYHWNNPDQTSSYPVWARTPDDAIKIAAERHAIYQSTPRP